MEYWESKPYETEDYVWFRAKSNTRQDNEFRKHENLKAAIKKEIMEKKKRDAILFGNTSAKKFKSIKSDEQYLDDIAETFETKIRNAFNSGQLVCYTEFGIFSREQYI